MTLPPETIERIAALTLAHYDTHADEFWEGTRNHDVSQNIAALLQYIEAAPPFRARSGMSCAFGRRIRDAMLGAKRSVWLCHTSDSQQRSAPEAGESNVQVVSERALKLLDFGCGPGRDLKTFKELGHHPTGLEGAARLATMARAYSGCEVLQQNFLELHLPDAHFDGVFANAALFHVPSQALPGVLKKLHATLKPGGVLFSSNPRGDGREGWSGGRCGPFHYWPGRRDYIPAAGFVGP